MKIEKLIYTNNSGDQLLELEKQEKQEKNMKTKKEQYALLTPSTNYIPLNKRN